MIFQAGIENNNEGRSIAWALEHPGCFAYGVNADGALDKPGESPEQVCRLDPAPRYAHLVELLRIRD